MFVAEEKIHCVVINFHIEILKHVTKRIPQKVSLAGVCQSYNAAKYYSEIIALDTALFLTKK